MSRGLRYEDTTAHPLHVNPGDTERVSRPSPPQARRDRHRDADADSQAGTLTGVGGTSRRLPVCAGQRPHTTRQLAYAKTAIAHARIAGIPPDRIVTCWPLDRLLAWLSDPLRERLVPAKGVAEANTKRSNRSTG